MQKIKITPASLKPYKCTVCGHEQEIETNHYEPCTDICRSCSWKGEGFGPGVKIPALGEALYRAFEYSPDPD